MQAAPVQARRRPAPALAAAEPRRRPQAPLSLAALRGGGDPLGGSRPANIRRGFGGVRASYDAAQDSPNSRRHWAPADGLSADDAANPAVRDIIRRRARYESANNTYCLGILRTLARDIIGTGPRLTMDTGDRALDARIERAWIEWSAAVGLAAKLRTARITQARDGEVFAVLGSNPKLAGASPVWLDMRLVEADRVTDPAGTAFLNDPTHVDGIEFDEWGNPTAYSIRKAGGLMAGFAPGDFETVAASAVLHMFRQDRPGQHRGVSEISAALPLFADLRRYTLATVNAAEAAADFAGVVYTDNPVNGEAQVIAPLEAVELERNTLLTLPAGWKIGQISAAHPGTMYPDFKREILREIARVLDVPFNVAAGDSSGYNYASGRLDWQGYYRMIRVDQNELETAHLRRIAGDWLRELVSAWNLAPAVLEAPRGWAWDGTEHVDPEKEANAQATRLASGTTTLAYEFARQGKDWEAETRQRAKEAAVLRELGLPMPGAAAKTTASAGAGRDAEDAAA